LLAATLNQGNPDRNHKLWNIVSTERYILHMQVLLEGCTFRYIDDVLSLNNFSFGDFVDRIYPIELEIKDTKDTDRSASYLDLHLEIDSEGRLRTKLYDKRDDFNFPIANFPFICSNIRAAPAYGVHVYISQLIRYSKACGSYQDFLDRGLLPTRKLLWNISVVICDTDIP
jgi:hypothetical protein